MQLKDYSQATLDLQDAEPCSADLPEGLGTALALIEDNRVLSKHQYGNSVGWIWQTSACHFSEMFNDAFTGFF